MNFSKKKSIAIIAALSVFIVYAAVIGWWVFMGRRTRIPATTVAAGTSTDTAPLATSVLSHLEIPWELVFLPDGNMVFTERNGIVNYVDVNRGLAPIPILTVPGVAPEGEGGLCGMALHPNFTQNGYIYFYHTYYTNGGLGNRVVRYQMQGIQLSDTKVIFDGMRGEVIHDGGRIKFGPDGYLYVTCGDSSARELAQDLNSLNGKIMRVKDDGSIPDDNPFPGSPVYSYGHRNPEGLAWDDKGQLWETEHGNIAHDEVNLIKPGHNYGWPVIEGDETAPGMETPVINSGRDTWAPAGCVFFNGSLYFTGLRGQSLFELAVTGGTPSLKRYFYGNFGRLRDVVIGPDGLFYLLTNNRDGRGFPSADDDQIIRVNPTKLSAALERKRYFSGFTYP